MWGIGSFWLNFVGIRLIPSLLECMLFSSGFSLFWYSGLMPFHFLPFSALLAWFHLILTFRPCIFPLPSSPLVPPYFDIQTLCLSDSSFSPGSTLFWHSDLVSFHFPFSPPPGSTLFWHSEVPSTEPFWQPRSQLTPLHQAFTHSHSLKPDVTYNGLVDSYLTHAAQVIDATYMQEV